MCLYTAPGRGNLYVCATPAGEGFGCNEDSKGELPAGVVGYRSDVSSLAVGSMCEEAHTVNAAKRCLFGNCNFKFEETEVRLLPSCE